MALIRPIGLDPELTRMAEETARTLRETAEYYRAQQPGQDGADDSPARARDRMHEYRKAAVAALEDGRRVRDELNRTRGIVRDYALDLKAARDDVERLLDRFAAAAGACEVP